MVKIPIAYIEMPSNDVIASKQFYGSLFGWSFEDFGPEYAAFSNSGVDGGFNGDSSDATAAPLVVLQTDAIEAVEKKIVAAGGTITRAMFAFPGGRRFHFTDLSGNELAVMQPD